MSETEKHSWPRQRLNQVQVNALTREFMRLQVIGNELELHAAAFLARVEEFVQAQRAERPPNAVIQVMSLSGGGTDARVNAAFKAYLMTLRQGAAMIFKILRFLAPAYEEENPRHRMPDAWKNGKFTPFMKGLVADEYEYDPEILDALKKVRDLFIMGRILRNEMKAQGMLPVMLVDGVFTVRCVLRTNSLDSSVTYLRKLRVPKEEPLATVEIPPEFVRLALNDFKVLSGFLYGKFGRARPA